MITVNGAPLDWHEGMTVSSLLEQQGLKAERVAVELGGRIVRRADFAQTPLADGDKIEIVHFVGGG